MSYPSQPSFTPPYGQPPAPRQTNLWLVGTAIIVALIVIMTVTLLILQNTQDESTEGGDGGDPTTAAEETTEEEPTEEEPTEEEPTEEEPTGGEAAGFSEETCGAFDPSNFESLYGEALDPDETYSSASSSGDTGSLSCTFNSPDYDTVSIYVYAWNDADGALEWMEDDREYWGGESDYTVTDYTAVGDAGFHVVFGEGDDYQKRGIHIVAGALEIEVEAWIYESEHGTEEADEYLQTVAEEALAMFADYV
jgi:hypothetical protein